ncbi:Conserved_hypothetical protein [Hexamita inflata]|uniref:Transmembrane protein n=1 Tax=Hexamita inflata TaxID=28002 RepID=A0ABP1GMX1_9EUKA
MIFIYQTLLEQSFVEDLAQTYLNTLNLQSGLHQLIQNLSRDSQPQSTERQVSIHQVITKYISKRMKLLDQFQPFQLVNNSLPICSELPLLNGTTDATNERYNVNMNLSIGMKTHYNLFLEQKDSLNINQSFIDEMKLLTGQLDIMDTGQMANVFEEIIYVDEKLSTYIYPYNNLQYDFDASLTMASFVFDQMDNLDFYIDLNVNEKELELQKLLLMSIINMISQTIYLNIYTIGSEITLVFSGQGYNVEYNYIYTQIKISSKSINIFQLISLFDNLYSNQNITLVFILSKGIKCDFKENYYEKQYNNTQFIFLNPKIVSIFKISQSTQQTSLQQYIQQINKLQTIINQQDQYIIMNLKQLQAKLIETNVSYEYKNLQQLKDYFILQIYQVLMNYIGKGYTITNLILTSQNQNNDMMLYLCKPVFHDQEYKGIVGMSISHAAIIDYLTAQFEEYINQNALLFINEQYVYDYQQILYLYRYSASNQQGERPLVSLMDQQQIIKKYGYVWGYQYIHFSFSMPSLHNDQILINDQWLSNYMNSGLKSIDAKVTNRQFTKKMQIINNLTKIQIIQEDSQKLYFSTYQSLLHNTGTLTDISNSRLTTVQSSQFFADKLLKKKQFNINPDETELSKYNDCLYFKQQLQTDKCLNYYDNEIQVTIPWKALSFHKIENNVKINILTRTIRKDSRILKAVKSISVNQMIQAGQIQLALGVIFEVDKKLAWFIQLERFIYFQQKQYITQSFCVMIRVNMMHMCTKEFANQPFVSLYSIRVSNKRTFYQSQISIVPQNSYDRQITTCAGCYEFSNQLQIIYNPKYVESSISYSHCVNNMLYILQSRIMDQVTSKGYFDIAKRKSQQDFAQCFIDEQNIVYINQFSMFVAIPVQYSLKQPKFMVNYYNLLEATICQPQKFNEKLVKLLFKCGMTQIYYQMDGGQYCIRNQMINLTETKTCDYDGVVFEVSQITGSGIYQIKFLTPNYQQFLNEQQYSNCFTYINELNDYVIQLQHELKFVFEFPNQNNLFENLNNMSRPQTNVQEILNVREQKRNNLVSALVWVSFVFILFVFVSEN